MTTATTSLRAAGRLCSAPDPRIALVRPGATRSRRPAAAATLRSSRPQRPSVGGYARSTGSPSRQVAATAPRSTGRRARLTPRGRVLLLLLISGLLLVAFSLGRVSTSASDTVAKQPTAQTVVTAGDTLWSIAVRVAPGNDPRETVGQLMRLNHLSGVDLSVGQQLLLPSPSHR